MTNLLRKIFIKDYKNTSDPSVRSKHGFLASFMGAFTNLILFGFKLAIGLLTASVSIITDAINNLSDMASCLVNIVGFKLASKPADKKHPYGHERIEYIAGMIISFVIIFLACFLFYLSIQKIIKNEPVEVNMWVFIILSVAIIVKIWQSVFYKKIAKLINSVSIKASSQDALNDVISTSVVLVITILEFIFQKYNINVPFSIDGVAGIGLSIFIIIMGIKLIIETANPLIGITPDNELIKKIVTDIKGYKGVLGIHDLMCHSYGATKIFITIHVEVDAKVNVMKSHDLIDNIEYDINKKYNVLLTIHMDPIDTSSTIVIQLKQKIANIIYSYSKDLSFHDFRIVKGDTHTNILFDVVIPLESKINKIELQEYLISKVKEIDDKYNLVLKIDDEFISKH